jgi:hypothetical protein
MILPERFLRLVDRWSVSRERRLGGMIRVLLPALFASVLPWTLTGVENARVTFTAAGGSPLLLLMTVDDPSGTVRTVVVESDESRLERVVPRDNEGPLVYPVAPVASPGVHGLTVTLRTSHVEDRRSYRLSFVDYRWGRDNFRFANDGQFRGEVDSYSELLYPWLEDRFGDVSDDDRAVLLHFAYDLLREQMGLCYAFAGSIVRYMRYPDELPRYNESIYAIRESNRVVREEMYRLQNDLVFQRFVTGTVDLAPQDHRQVAREVAILRAAVDRGDPVVVGVLAPSRHHAMVAYGYVEELRSGAVTIILANNWDREVRDNLSNESVEAIIAHPRPTGTDRDVPLRWPDARHAPYREPTHIVSIDPEREYVHRRETLDNLVGHRREEILAAGRRLLIVEGVRSVRLRDVPDSGEEEDPSVIRINTNAVVDLPRAIRYELEITAREDDDGVFQEALMYEMVPDAGTVRVTRSVLSFDERTKRLTVGE